MDRDDRDERPLYLKIADQLRARILAGELGDGDRLPSVPALAADVGISRSTAADALKVLISEGLAVARSGAGTFVKARPATKPMVRAWYAAIDHSAPQTDVESQGREAGWSYNSRTELAPPAIRGRLALSEPDEDAPDEDVVHTDYVLQADGEPVMLSSSWEPLILTRGTPIVLPEDGMHAGRGVAERMLSIGVVIDDWVEEIGARPGTAGELERLQRPPGSVVITITRTYYAGERPVETADIVIPADAYTLVYAGRMGRPGNS